MSYAISTNIDTGVLYYILVSKYILAGQVWAFELLSGWRWRKRGVFRVELWPIGWWHLHVYVCKVLETCDSLMWNIEHRLFPHYSEWVTQRCSFCEPKSIIWETQVKVLKTVAGLFLMHVSKDLGYSWSSWQNFLHVCQPLLYKTSFMLVMELSGSSVSLKDLISKTILKTVVLEKLGDKVSRLISRSVAKLWHILMKKSK